MPSLFVTGASVVMYLCEHFLPSLDVVGVIRSPLSPTETKASEQLICADDLILMRIPVVEGGALVLGLVNFCVRVATARLSHFHDAETSFDPKKTGRDPV